MLVITVAEAVDGLIIVVKFSWMRYLVEESLDYFGET